MLFCPEVSPCVWANDKSDPPVSNYLTLDWLRFATHANLQHLLCCYSLVIVNGHWVIPDQIVPVSFHSSLMPAHIEY